MKTAIDGVIVIAFLLAALCTLAAVRRYLATREAFDIMVGTDHDPIVDLGTADDLAFDEAEHVKALAPSVTFVPDGFTCLGCRENPALPFKVWCAVCLPLSDRHFRSSPIERGQR